MNLIKAPYVHSWKCQLLFYAIKINNILNQGSEFHFGKRCMHKEGASSVCFDITSPVSYQIQSLLTHCLQEERGFNTKNGKLKICKLKEKHKTLATQSKRNTLNFLWHKGITFSTLSLWSQLKKKKPKTHECK